ncbi:MAG: hypothetical protein M0037_07630 [Betaproteobacteria bacterium]|nr:hypothetical protein [Betaproteobacteria bacterium]
MRPFELKTTPQALATLPINAPLKAFSHPGPVMTDELGIGD